MNRLIARISAAGLVFVVAGCEPPETYVLYKNPLGDLTLSLQYKLAGDDAVRSVDIYLIGESFHDKNMVLLGTAKGVAKVEPSWTSDYTVNVCELAGQAHAGTIKLRTQSGADRTVIVTSSDCGPAAQGALTSSATVGLAGRRPVRDPF